MPVSSAIIEMLPFRKYFKKIGRVYMGQSIALIDLCRYLVEKYLDSDDQDLQMYHSVPYPMNHIRSTQHSTASWDLQTMRYTPQPMLGRTRL